MGCGDEFGERLVEGIGEHIEADLGGILVVNGTAVGFHDPDLEVLVLDDWADDAVEDGGGDEQRGNTPQYLVVVQDRVDVDCS